MNTVAVCWALLTFAGASVQHEFVDSHEVCEIVRGELIDAVCDQHADDTKRTRCYAHVEPKYACVPCVLVEGE